MTLYSQKKLTGNLSCSCHSSCTYHLSAASGDGFCQYFLFLLLQTAYELIYSFLSMHHDGTCSLSVCEFGSFPFKCSFADSQLLVKYILA